MTAAFHVSVQKSTGNATDMQIAEDEIGMLSSNFFSGMVNLVNDKIFNQGMEYMSNRSNYTPFVTFNGTTYEATSSTFTTSVILQFENMAAVSFAMPILLNSSSASAFDYPFDTWSSPVLCNIQVDPADYQVTGSCSSSSSSSSTTTTDGGTSRSTATPQQTGGIKLDQPVLLRIIGVSAAVAAVILLSVLGYVNNSRGHHATPVSDRPPIIVVQTTAPPDGGVATGVPVQQPLRQDSCPSQLPTFPTEPVPSAPFAAAWHASPLQGGRASRYIV